MLPLIGRASGRRSRCWPSGCGPTASSALMADRDLTRNGVQVDFFGEPTRMPAGPARLAIETGAALLPTHRWYEKDGWGFDLSPAAGHVVG